MPSLKTYVGLVCLSVIFFSQDSLSFIKTKKQQDNDVILMNKGQLNENSPTSYERPLVGAQNRKNYYEAKRENRKRSKRSPEIHCSSNNVRLQNLAKSAKDFLTDNILDINNTHSKLSLTWSGLNTGVLIAVTFNDIKDTSESTSLVYRSVDNGRSFTKINDKFEKKNLLIHPRIGLQKNAVDSTYVYLIEDSINMRTSIHVSENSGEDWKNVDLPFPLYRPFLFHGKNKNLILSYSGTSLYLSTNAGYTWKLIEEKAQDYIWSDIEDNIVYITVLPEKKNYKGYLLFKFNIVSNLKEQVMSGVINCGSKGKFLYASVMTEQVGIRKMMVSNDNSSTWREAQIPRIESDRFYAIMDMSEGMIFLHVDNNGTSGHGILYTSGPLGLIYTESLQRHLYPEYQSSPYANVTDFYRVQSMDGVYLASQLLKDQTIRTVISYNRGVKWQTIDNLKGSKCQKKPCNLQVYNSFSRSQSVNGFEPVSISNIPGLIIVHGHVGAALQTTPTDVFISNDGGYSFFFALTGPHWIQIADHGGLIVAVPKTQDYTKKLKFSIDEGRCWIEYPFTKKNITVTGVLTEPGNRAMIVSIWGYTPDFKWNVIVIDFSKVITEKCEKSDYELFKQHKDECYLGKKRTLRKLKKDSFCQNGYEYDVKIISETICDCTKEDYECDYSYYRDTVTDFCVKAKQFKGEDLYICERGHTEEIISEGYRLVPGDKCENGFKPKSKKIILSEKCYNEEKIFAVKKKHVSVGVIIFSVLFSIIIIAAVIAFLWRRRFGGGSKSAMRYSQLREDNLKGISVWSDESKDENEPYDDELILNTKSDGNIDEKKLKPFHDDSDVDMLE